MITEEGDIPLQTLSSESKTGTGSTTEDSEVIKIVIVGDSFCGKTALSMLRTIMNLILVFLVVFVFIETML